MKLGDNPPLTIFNAFTRLRIQRRSRFCYQTRLNEKPSTYCPVAAQASNAYYNGAVRLRDASDSVHKGITAVPGYALGIPATVGQTECLYEALFGRPCCISEGVGCNANNDRTSQQQHLVAGRQCGNCHRLPSTPLLTSIITPPPQWGAALGKSRLACL